MLPKRVTLAILAVRALSALASPVFTVQNSDLHVASDDVCSQTESANPLASSPEVHLDDGLFVGIQEGKTDGFLGIAFALPPTGDRRLRLAKPTLPYVGTNYAQEFGRSCPQQALSLPNGLNSRLVEDLGKAVNRIYQDVIPSDEDCLTINIWKPSTATPSSQLPVLVWIFGGGFEVGGTNTYNGASVVARSIDLKQPVIVVSMNYRLSAFGFLPGKEVKDEKVGNLGLQDQRLALKWIQTYIREFGGDPQKVTIWGESAGAISVSLHMLAKEGNHEGLFRGAIMQSGGPIPVGDIENGQKYYDFMVSETGCSKQRDTLDCLRRVPYNTYKRAMDASPNFFAYQALVLAWLPRADGDFLTEPPQYGVIRGHVADVPMITGNCDDEGSLFSISTRNISSTAQLKDYLKLFMMPKATEQEINDLLVHYPDDLRAGCPFDTGLKNALGPQFKRVAALQGDFVFHGPRRMLLKYRANKQNSWGFIWKRIKDTPFIGSVHGIDLVSAWAPNGELRDYFIRFANTLDPNGKEGLGISWPKWDPAKPKALVGTDSLLTPLTIQNDNYRSRAMDYVGNLSIRHPI